MIINDKIEQLENLKCHCSDMARGEALSSEWMKDIEALDFAIATIKQEPKTGHWIVEVWNNRERHTCSVCQRMVDYEPCYHYCPYCGAEMESEASE